VTQGFDELVEEQRNAVIALGFDADGRGSRRHFATAARDDLFLVGGDEVIQRH
jgi:hypothetical protein